MTTLVLPSRPIRNRATRRHQPHPVSVAAPSDSPAAVLERHHSRTSRSAVATLEQLQDHDPQPGFREYTLRELEHSRRQHQLEQQAMTALDRSLVAHQRASRLWQQHRHLLAQLITQESAAQEETAQEADSTPSSPAHTRPADTEPLPVLRAAHRHLSRRSNAPSDSPSSHPTGDCPT